MAQPYVNHSLDPRQVVTLRARMNENNIMDVRAPLPESIPFSTGNDIDETFDFFKLASKLAQSVGVASGVSIDRGLAEQQQWRGIINQEFSMDLQFQAYNSGKDDVVIPVKTLLLMSSPEPTTANLKVGTKKLWLAPPRVSIKFGNIITLTSVWIKTINVQFSNKLDDNYDPMSATVSITFIPRDPLGRFALGSERQTTQGINDVVKYSFNESALKKGK